MVPNGQRIRPEVVNAILSCAEGDDLLSSLSADDAFKSESVAALGCVHLTRSGAALGLNNTHV